MTAVNLISKADYDETNRRSKVHRGDIIMPMIGTIGSPVLVDIDPEFAIKNVALIKFGKKSPSNTYIHRLLSSHYFDRVLSRNNRGGTQKFVALRDIRDFPIPCPPEDLQSRFEEVANGIANTSHNLHVAALQTDALFASIQTSAFRQ